MDVNKIGLMNVLKVNYKLSKSDSNFEVGFNILLKEMIWYIGEKLDENGELKGNMNRHVRQKFWSENAIECFNSQNKNRFKNLIFEHVVPIKLIKERIIKMLIDDIEVDKIVEFLDEHLLVCIVTKEEDKKLNDCGYKSKLGAELTKYTVWNRYKNSSIKVCKVEAIKVGGRYFIKTKSYLSY